MVRYSFLVQAWVWGEPDPPEKLPANLAVPFVALADRIGFPPVMNYAGYILDNWYRLDKQAPIELGNVMQNQALRRRPRRGMVRPGACRQSRLPPAMRWSWRSTSRPCQRCGRRGAGRGASGSTRTSVGQDHRDLRPHGREHRQHRGIQADHVRQRQRPDRMVAAQLHAPSISSGDARPSPSTQNASLIIGQRMRFDHEARAVLHRDRILAQPLGQILDSGVRGIAGLQPADQLHQRHHRHRVEEVHADEAVRAARSPRPAW